MLGQLTAPLRPIPNTSAMEGLTKEDSSRIGFVVSALMTGAIDSPEVGGWAEHVLSTSLHYPPWIIDLLDFQEAAFHIYRVIGFAPSSCLTSSQDRALAGIALLRGREIDTTVVSVAAAKRALISHPEILARFQAEFPSIVLPESLLS